MDNCSLIHTLLFHRSVVLRYTHSCLKLLMSNIKNWNKLQLIQSLFEMACSQHFIFHRKLLVDNFSIRICFFHDRHSSFRCCSISTPKGFGTRDHFNRSTMIYRHEEVSRVFNLELIYIINSVKGLNPGVISKVGWVWSSDRPSTEA